MQQFTIKDISSEALKNYFNIFGFVKISGFFIDEIDNISKEFDLAMNKKFGNKKANDRNYFYPQFVEHDQNLASILELEKIEKVITNLLGENPIYTGSDGNIFSDSTPWHRDYLNKNRSCKMLVYLDEIDGDSGALRVIPGSHFVDDKYSSFLGDGLNWPEPPYEGGFDEKCFFGKGHNPRKIGENNLIPNHVVPNNPGDIIIFNHNLIHCTNYALVPSFKYDKRLGFKKKNIRRMFGLHFFASPSNIKDEALQKKLTKDMEQLFLIELKTFKLKNRFGPCVAESKSEKIKNYIKEIKHIEYNESEGDFDGKYIKQSDESISFNGKLRKIFYNSNLDVN